MQLLELQLHNYKVHRKKTLKFEPGVVGIVGDNGSGKSSIISAICFLFTGEVDTPKKADSLTLGETEGWVKGKFVLNGKEGTLERHINSSKVELTYDDVKYNKVSEVNQLWNDLLKIDSTIFNNVIVAKQGEIQSLFSDETTVREKIFQKIFMVPPTEKIRSVIWDNYIKTCPPEKPEEDIQQLMSMQAQVAKDRNAVMQEADMKTASIPDVALLRCIADRVTFLEKCGTDLLKRPELETKLAEYKEEMDSIDTMYAQAYNMLINWPDTETLTARKSKLIGDRSLHGRKESISLEIENMKATDADFTKLESKLAKQDKLKIEQYEEVTETNSKLKEIVGQKNHLLHLRGHAICPTCYQEIPDTEKLLNSLMTQEVELKGKFDKSNAAYQATAKQVQTLNGEVAKIQALVQRKTYLLEELTKLGHVNYSEEAFVEVQQLIATRVELERDLQVKKNRKVELSAEVRVLDEKINNLASYDGTSTIESELSLLQAALAENKQLQDDIASLQLKAGKLEHELLLLDSRIANSEVNYKYNRTRKKYLDKLVDMHELFHVGKFPRKLIETYMDSVQASLATYLDYFNLPYTVKVEEGFKIRMYNGGDKALPQVSGGQEMMIGICLRLALHKMFAKAFPIWIIDEGTTHLSESKKQNYFELINELRNQRIINQIIIIDHDERLSTVVDQTIQL